MKGINFKNEDTNYQNLKDTKKETPTAWLQEPTLNAKTSLR